MWIMIAWADILIFKITTTPFYLSSLFLINLRGDAFYGAYFNPKWQLMFSGLQ